MNRYLLFVGEIFYANGGWHDFADSFPDLVIAIMRGKELLDKEDIQWYHVVDINTGDIVFKSEHQAYGVY